MASYKFKMALKVVAMPTGKRRMSSHLLVLFSPESIPVKKSVIRGGTCSNTCLPSGSPSARQPWLSSKLATGSFCTIILLCTCLT